MCGLWFSSSHGVYVFSPREMFKMYLHFLVISDTEVLCVKITTRVSLIFSTKIKYLLKLCESKCFFPLNHDRDLSLNRRQFIDFIPQNICRNVEIQRSEESSSSSPHYCKLFNFNFMSSPVFLCFLTSKKQPYIDNQEILSGIRRANQVVRTDTD
jgi:hypothetical protein